MLKLVDQEGCKVVSFHPTSDWFAVSYLREETGVKVYYSRIAGWALVGVEQSSGGDMPVLLGVEPPGIDDPVDFSSNFVLFNDPRLNRVNLLGYIHEKDMNQQSIENFQLMAEVDYAEKTRAELRDTDKSE